MIQNLRGGKVIKMHIKCAFDKERNCTDECVAYSKELELITNGCNKRGESVLSYAEVLYCNRGEFLIKELNRDF